MKIAVLRRRWSAAGGGERFAQAFMEALLAAGHEVHLVAERWRQPPRGAHLHRVPSLPGGSAIRTLAYAVLAPRVARAAGVDVVHSLERTVAQDVYRAGEGCHRQWLDLQRRHLGRRTSTWRLFHRVVLVLESRICRGQAARQLVVSSRLVDGGFRGAYGPLGVPVALVRNGVDLARFDPAKRRTARAAARQALELAPADLALLLLGSGFARKGVRTAVLALAALDPRREATLIVAGRGTPAQFVALARRHGVERRVRFVGPQDDALSLYAAADLFVLPSIYDPASNATLEAMAMGLPVVTASTNGSSEVIEHGVSGWVLDDPSDARGLAGLLDEAADAGRRDAVARAARERVAPWSWERHVRETLALYETLTAGATR